MRFYETLAILQNGLGRTFRIPRTIYPEALIMARV